MTSAASISTAGELTEHAGWSDPFDVPLAAGVEGKRAERPCGLGGEPRRPGRHGESVRAGCPGGCAHGGGHGRPGRHPVRRPDLGATCNCRTTSSSRAPSIPTPNRHTGFLPKTAGWYRKTFDLSADDRNRVLWLEFDGVYRDSVVWLNGHQLGRHESGYTSFYYDISRFANYGGANVLSVWADARQDEGWWYEGGGIYRHVYLTRLSPMHIDHWGMQIFAAPSEDFRKAEVVARIDLVNEGEAGASIQVESTLVDPEGRPVGTVVAPGQPDLAPGERRTVTQGLSVDQPRLWSPDTPALYTLRTTARRGGEILDQQETNVGIRSLRWDADQGFFLNGKPFKIQGTCNHQDFAGLGVALPDRVHYYKVEKLKEMGSNAFRFSHQPMAPELLDACDRLGNDRDGRKPQAR